MSLSPKGPAAVVTSLPTTTTLVTILLLSNSAKCAIILISFIILMLTTLVNIYSVNVPDTVNVATVQDPTTAVVLVPGATA